jgi:hypothetical protein
MDEVWARAAGAGLAAGLVAVLVTRLIERLGGRLGGVLGTAPTTVVPAALGLLGQPEADFVASMATVPVGMWVNAVFLGCWRWLPGRLGALPGPAQLPAMILSSLGVWAAVGLLALQGLRLGAAGGLPPLAIGLLALLSSLGLGLWSCRGGLHAPGASRPVRPAVLVARAALAAVAIGAAVLTSSLAGPVVAGLAAVFPAIFLTTMVSLWVSQGAAVQGAAVGPMMLGSASVSAYALLAAFLLPWLGGPLGSVAAWLLSVGLVTGPAAWALRPRPTAPR